MIPADSAFLVLLLFLSISISTAGTFDSGTAKVGAFVRERCRLRTSSPARNHLADELISRRHYDMSAISHHVRRHAHDHFYKEEGNDAGGLSGLWRIGIWRCYGLASETVPPEPAGLDACRKIWRCQRSFWIELDAAHIPISLVVFTTNHQLSPPVRRSSSACVVAEPAPSSLKPPTRVHTHRTAGDSEACQVETSSMPPKGASQFRHPSHRAFYHRLLTPCSPLFDARLQRPHFPSSSPALPVFRSQLPTPCKRSCARCRALADPLNSMEAILGRSRHPLDGWSSNANETSQGDQAPLS